MNLAIKDIRHNLGRFILTTLGVGLLLIGLFTWFSPFVNRFYVKREEDEHVDGSVAK